MLTPDQVVDAALAMIERDGPDALSMRKLATELGVSANSIYWHVGGREMLLAAAVARAGERYGKFTVRGASPRERIRWILRRVLDTALDHHHIHVLAHEIGRTAELEKPMQLAVARELTAAGLTGQNAARVMRGLLYAVGGLIVIAYRDQERMPELFWTEINDPGIDPQTLTALAKPADVDELFEPIIGSLVNALVP